MTFASEVRFATGRALDDRRSVVLGELVEKTKGVNVEVIIVTGHTDNVGSPVLNQRLSQRRAEEVKRELVQRGVDPNRIYTEGKGSSQPVADNRTTEGRARNRRVEVEIVGTRPVSR